MVVSYRQHATKPATALWALVGVLLLYRVGMLVMLVLTAIVMAVGAVLVLRHHPLPVRRPQARQHRQPNVVGR